MNLYVPGRYTWLYLNKPISIARIDFPNLLIASNGLRFHTSDVICDVATQTCVINGDPIDEKQWKMDYIIPVLDDLPLSDKRSLFTYLHESILDIEQMERDMYIINKSTELVHIKHPKSTTSGYQEHFDVILTCGYKKSLEFYNHYLGKSLDKYKYETLGRIISIGQLSRAANDKFEKTKNPVYQDMSNMLYDIFNRCMHYLSKVDKASTKLILPILVKIVGYKFMWHLNVNVHKVESKLGPARYILTDDSFINIIETDLVFPIIRKVFESQINIKSLAKELPVYKTGTLNKSTGNPKTEFTLAKEKLVRKWVALFTTAMRGTICFKRGTLEEYHKLKEYGNSSIC